MRVVEPWKVTDLVVPMRGGEIKEEDAGTEGAEENVRGGDVTGTPRRERTSEEERRVSILDLMKLDDGDTDY